MRVWRSLEEVPAGLPYPVVTIGNFDGVHIGHKRLFAEVKQRAAANHGTSLVITLDPHPTRIVAPERTPRLLTPLPVKLELFRQAGVDTCFVMPFTTEVSHMSPRDFVAKVLAGRIGAREIIDGENFHFGYKQAGNIDTLRQLGPEFRLTAEALKPVTVRGEVVSSSRIRKVIAEGRMGLANRMLGRCFSVRGRIVSGLAIGRSRTVPTLNLEHYEEMLPGDGVYATETACDGVRAISVTNVGMSPTFHVNQLRVESFLLDQTPPPTANEMEIFFWYRLREERVFPSAESLKAQILKDAGRTQRFFRRLRGSLQFHE